MVISIAMMIVYPRVFNLPKIVEHLWPARSPGFSKIVVVLSLQLLYAFVFYEIQGNRPNPVLYHHFLHENDNSHYIGGFCIIFPDIFHMILPSVSMPRDIRMEPGKYRNSCRRVGTQKTRKASHHGDAFWAAWYDIQGCGSRYLRPFSADAHRCPHVGYSDE